MNSSPRRESRRQTIERIAQTDPAVAAAVAPRDPSTRRRLGLRMLIASLTGIAIGAAVVLVAQAATGRTAFALALGGVALLVSASVTPIFVAEGDDELVDHGRHPANGGRAG